MRGIAIVLMIIYHLLYDMKFMFDVKMDFFTIKSWYPVQQFICWTFIFLSGFSVSFSKNSTKNAIKIILAAMTLTLVTNIVVPDFAINFGVLHLIGFSMLIISLIHKNETKYPLIKGIMSFVIFFIIWKFGLERLSFFNRLGDLGFLFPLGFYSPTFTSSDYFPLLPWFFLNLTGFYFGKYNLALGNPLKKIEFNGGFISLLGRHSLKIYMAHQVVIFICLTILQKIGII